MTYHCGKKACFGRGCKCVCVACCAARAEEVKEQRERELRHQVTS